ncbi:MAG: aldose 1-epimerase [Bacteroidetes bacterium]|jgi:aldose 1-epimerase|nr:aldose 1-epimerase [Bacteroidota bacterium]
MSFQIQIAPLSHFEVIRLIDTSNKAVVEICTKGALLNSWQAVAHHKTLQLIEGNDFSKGWGNFEHNGFRGGKMSPFSCRLENGEYSMQETTYKIEKFYHEKHALHGILYDAVFTIQSTETDANGASVNLKFHYEGNDKGFPFPYSLLIKWQLHKNNIITVETIITNLSNSDIPMMDGWHPYFKIGETINDCFVTLNSMGKVEYNEMLIPTGEMLQENEFETSKKIGSAHLDNCYCIAQKSNACIVENEWYQLVVQPLLNYPYLQLYTPADRKSIAIENLSGIPNCFNNKIGLQIMKPHQNLVLKTSYQFIIK